MSVTVLEEALEAMEQLTVAARAAGIEPNQSRTFRLFTTNEVCSFLGKSTTTIYKCEQMGIIDKPAVNTVTGRRIGYTLGDVNKLRAHFSIKPNKWPSSRERDERLSIVAALYNFKGGVGKTTTTITYGQYLALLGYKVLLIDMDSQGSLTSLFGKLPDEVDESETVIPYTVKLQHQTLHYAIKNSHIDGLDYICANNDLSYAEWEGAATISGEGESGLTYFQRLRNGIDTIKEEYDFILIDAPPSLGIIGLQTAVAADNLIIPCVPRMLDFASTKQFLSSAVEYVYDFFPEKEFKTIKVLATMIDRRPSGNSGFLPIMDSVLGDLKFANEILSSQSIDNSSAVFQTPWEADKPDKRIIQNMRSTFNEITEHLIEGNV